MSKNNRERTLIRLIISFLFGSTCGALFLLDLIRGVSGYINSTTFMAAFFGTIFISCKSLELVDAGMAISKRHRKSIYLWVLSLQSGFTLLLVLLAEKYSFQDLSSGQGSYIFLAMSAFGVLNLYYSIEYRISKTHEGD